MWKSTNYVSSGLEVKTGYFSENFLSTYKFTWSPNPEQQQHFDCHENLWAQKSLKRWKILLLNCTIDVCHQTDVLLTLMPRSFITHEKSVHVYFLPAGKLPPADRASHCANTPLATPEEQGQGYKHRQVFSSVLPTFVYDSERCLLGHVCWILVTWDHFL
jgi:hypothetical protein